MGTRVDWTPEERQKWRDAAIELLKQRKFKPPKDWIGLGHFMKIAREAQIVLPENRRRQLHSTHTMEPDFKFFIDAGFLPANVLDLKKGAAKRREEAQDPNVIRINQISDERDKAIELALQEEMRRKTAEAEVQVLRSRLAQVPSEAQVIKTFIADILSDVQARGRALPGPTSAQINETVAAAATTLQAATSQLKRHDPTPQSQDKPRKPKVLVFKPKEYNFTIPWDKWVHDFPDLMLEQVEARPDGKVNVPMGAEEAILIDGIRHATSADVRSVYPGARRVAPGDIPKMLTSIQCRLKEAKGANQP